MLFTISNINAKSSNDHKLTKRSLQDCYTKIQHKLAQCLAKPHPNLHTDVKTEMTCVLICQETVCCIELAQVTLSSTFYFH